MLCRYYLQLGTDTLDIESADCMEVSGMIKNLDGIKVSYSRVDLGGVVRKCGSSLEFTGKAYRAILSHYEENYLQSKGVFAVYIADNNWEYSRAWDCPLDFATLQYDANTLTIGCVDNSVAATIKAYKKSKYEFNVESLKDAAPILYNGVVTRRSFTFYVTGQTPEGETTTDMVTSKSLWINSKGYYSLYLPSIGVSTDEFSSEKITCMDQDEYTTWSTASKGKNDGTLMKSLIDDNNINAGFVKCLEDCSVHIGTNLQFRFKYPDWWAGTAVTVCFILTVDDKVVWRKEVSDFSLVDVSIDEDFNMVAGQTMAFGMSILSGSSNWMAKLMPDGSRNPNTNMYLNPDMRWASNMNNCYVNESHYDNEPIDIDAVRPATILQALLDKMFANRSDIYVSGSIDEGGSLLPKTLLVAAESIRSLATKKIYSSFTDFCDFMEAVFGYVYTLEHVGYYMDAELAQIDRGERFTLSHIKMSYIISQSMSNVSEAGYFKMLPVGGIIEQISANMLDLTTEFPYEWESGHGVKFMEEVFYCESANTFVVQDWATGKWYANFVRRDAVTQGSWYNDGNGHAREMIGLNLTGFHDGAPYIFGIIRNGSIILCEDMHTSFWLDEKDNNSDVVSLIFKHRSRIFSDETIKTLSNVNNLSYQFDESKVFSDVEIGYPKSDYDNDNSALNEFNFTSYYKTDCDLNEQTLRLISPYRADCYGIEELLLKKKNSESTDSDDDVFIIIASASDPVDGKWQIDRSIHVSNAYSDSVFNAAIAPNIIVRNNEEYLGTSVSLLKFTSSDGNSDAIIGSNRMSANISIRKRMFKAGNISIDTDDHRFPDNWDGVIEFEHAGKTYRGYLDSIDINFANLGTITYNIIEKCIE